MKKIKTIILAIAGLFLFAISGCEPAGDKASPHIPPPTDAYIQLNRAMRNLWSDHMHWTYVTVDAYLNNKPAFNAHIARLLQNQRDIGNAIKPYYGQANGDTLAALLAIHIKLAPHVLNAAKSGNQHAVDSTLANWYANAEDIADFLSAANPHWPQDTMRHHMRDHISTTTTYAVDLLQKKYPKAVIDYEVAFAHMMMLADALTDGIVKQHPDKFH